MPRTQQIIHNGKSIFYMDFSNIALASEIRNIINESIMYIHSQAPESVLTLSNISSMRFSNEVKDLFNDFIEGNKPFIKASAVIGLNGLQFIFNGLLKITHRNIKTFSSEIEAKNWLAAME
jgi:hypothetical protein